MPCVTTALVSLTLPLGTSSRNNLPACLHIAELTSTYLEKLYDIFCGPAMCKQAGTLLRLGHEGVRSPLTDGQNRGTKYSRSDRMRITTNWLPLGLNGAQCFYHSIKTLILLTMNVRSRELKGWNGFWKSYFLHKCPCMRIYYTEWKKLWTKLHFLSFVWGLHCVVLDREKDTTMTTDVEENSWSLLLSGCLLGEISDRKQLQVFSGHRPVFKKYLFRLPLK